MRILLSALFLSTLFGQGPAVRPSFDVAAIKPGESKSPLAGIAQISAGGRLDAESVTLKRLIEVAYQSIPFQVTGGPRWIETEKFSIAAKSADETATLAQTRLMLQSLLAERFQLTMHIEMREQTVYRLTVNDKHGLVPAGNRRGFSAKVSPDGSTHFAFQGMTMLQLASRLAGELQAIVEDRTGLSGGFDFEMDGTSEKGSFGSAAPSLPQVGLKLESRKAPVEFLVVDRAEKPSEN